MKKSTLIFFSLFTSILPIICHAALDRVNDFALLDESGVFHQLSRYQHREALVVMSFDESCTSMSAMLQEYSSVSQELSSQDIEFLLIDSVDLGREALVNLGLEFPILEDSGQLVSESLGIKNAGEVLVLNPERLAIFYRGTVGLEFRASLGTLETIQDTIKSESVNCNIDYPVKVAHGKATPDYRAEVAPIIIENCVDCHKQGGVGPFAFDSYVMLLGWSPMIREVLLNKRMPPMQVDPYIGCLLYTSDAADE